MMNIRTLGNLLILFIILAGVTFVSSSILIKSELEDASQIWRQYQDRSSPKARAVDVLVTHLGYGGMIHQFKNYVLRKDAARIQKIRNGGGAAIAALDQYENAGVGSEERQALNDIRGVVTLYLKNMDMVEGLAKGGKDSRGIDKAVKISDKPALEGIEVLVTSISADRQSSNESTTKTEVLSQLCMALGYGGMIHQFKNYVLRQDAPRIAKIESNLGKATSAIDLYRTLDTTATEEQALKDIESVVKAYQDNLGTAISLARSGSTPEQIDKKVKISDKPALNGMKTILAEIAIQNTAEQKNLTGNFNRSNTLSDVILIISLLSSLFLVGFAYWIISRRIVSPIKDMIGFMSDLADGKLGTEVSGLEKSDEIGQMAKTVQVFKENALENKRLETQAEANREEITQQQQQQHDATEQARIEKETSDKVQNEKREEKLKYLTNITSDFEGRIAKIIETVAGAATELQSSSASMTSIAERTNGQTQAVAAASEQASVNVDTVATAADELSSSIQEISRQVATSSSVAKDAVSKADLSRGAVTELVESSKKINDVIQLITDIAAQTNLLALNATIEAARAGEAGKGFAVVATEVKSLADQTAKATDQISQQINDLQNSTKTAASAIEGIGQTIGQIDEISSSISSAVEEQSAATSEIAQNIEQASKGTGEVSSNIVQVSKGADETESTAGEIEKAADELSQQANLLQNEMGDFIEKIREAG